MGLSLKFDTAPILSTVRFISLKKLGLLCARFSLILALSVASSMAQAEQVLASIEDKPEQYLIQEIVWVGNKRTIPRVMLQELQIAVGDTVDAEALIRGQRNVMDLGLFKSVNIEPIDIPGGTRLQVTVEERYYLLPLPRVDVNSDGDVSWGGQIRWNNVTGRNETIKLKFLVRERSDGESEPRWSLRYNYPLVKGSDYGIEWGAAHDRSVFTDTGVEGLESERLAYDFLVTRSNFYLGPASKGLKAGIGLKWEDDTIKGTGAPNSPGQSTSVLLLATYNGLSVGLHSDEGRQATASFEYGPKGIGSDYHFSLWSFDYSQVHSIGKRANQSLGWRFKIGGYHAGPGPEFSEFSLGGGSSLRGFSRDQFQGDAFYQLSLEYLRPIFGREDLRFLAIFDIGGAYRDWESAELGDSHSNIGIGIRWRLKSFVETEFDIGVAFPLESGDAKVFGGSV